jgi:hypothetical protein
MCNLIPVPVVLCPLAGLNIHMRAPEITLTFTMDKLTNTAGEYIFSLCLNVWARRSGLVVVRSVSCMY